MKLFPLVMAGLVPAIHVLQNFRTAVGRKVCKIVVVNPNWDDLFNTIVQ